ncbi:hypothetical protein PMAYCL1PPCAC_23842 [Pristionchus mayeri]|uniref:Protein MCM10 homolog n=1 Tax=Pristionchus mayeri TaxID=1317129 RepID=A0AAN5D0Z4_9BILA|nr:hypothetical protein PMAYCL1PPCAC_23842 [Pristionchus mayeri]
MDDLLDDLLRDSDNEELSSSLQVPVPKVLNLKNRLPSPVKTGLPPSCLGVVKKKKVEDDLKIADPFFGIRFKSGGVDIEALRMLCKDMGKVSIMSKVDTSESSWVTVGVIIEKSGTLKSSSGNEYMIWKLHDLKNCEEKPTKALLFGEAVKEHWKLQKGNVVVMLSPQIILDSKTSELTLKISRSSSIVHIGSSVDLGKCKGRKQDGSECRAFVNVSKCEMCVYHAASEVRKLAARRGTFSHSILIPKKNDIIVKSSHKLHQVKPKIIANQQKKSKEEVVKCEKEALSSIVNSKTNFSLGAKCLAFISNTNEGIEEKKSAVSFREFLNSKEADKVTQVNTRTTKEEDAVKRALRVLQDNKKMDEEEKRNVKRARVVYKEEKEDNKIEVRRRDRVFELLAKRAKHATEAEGLEQEMEMEHLNALEKREAVESVATSCMQLKEVRVFSCSICKYTARARSDLCVSKGHPTKSHLATKRFFSCKECSFKCSTYSLLPTRRCQQCKSENWERVSMVQERRVVLDTGKLELRGEERTFIN